MKDEGIARQRNNYWNYGLRNGRTIKQKERRKGERDKRGQYVDVFSLEHRLKNQCVP
jgi:hypothetical protein